MVIGTTFYEVTKINRWFYHNICDAYDVLRDIIFSNRSMHMSYYNCKVVSV